MKTKIKQSETINSTAGTVETLPVSETSGTVMKLDITFTNEDSNKMVEKINEMIDHLNKNA